ncbi:Pimeloyl-ACP methyl ester carboxylesterase [Micromonospora phaseoli]|uniref:Pimeloyl-ACP methyl ester carboxylesterase n=1 Tax=Micromonospora phaseoli TaxID=1144548 RepID=A0A1H6R7U8_9ACTN|nr:alpha/beta fold hydrolase [Micromonospora phaseoli]PZW03289.1 pimeloyl-ACP methyl ester carboxylesterase [Micromonospora phaseoli]GIJ78377.1 carboxylesterase [Micromonospora phaseoli]SEI50556.1 Pimeloyl-ACP methyl ester carboxylesterase [Micromonospora phaseoli]
MAAVKEPGIGRFADDRAKEKFLQAYEVAMRSWPQPRQEFDVETSFGTIHVHRYGPTEGSPIVLLHGATGNSSNWYPQIATLGRHHPVYAVDTIDDPGRSVQRRPVVGTAENAAWLDETLTALDLDGVHLVGMSYGGFLALAHAVHRPARLASVTLLDPGGLEKVPLRFYANLIAGALATLAPRRTRPWFADKLANQALIEPAEQLAPIMIGARSWRTRRPPARPYDDQELRGIRVPVHLLVGERSSLLHPRRAVSRAQRLIPSVRAEIVPGAGHGLSLERPELVNQLVLDFIEDNPARRDQAGH